MSICLQTLLKYITSIATVIGLYFTIKKHQNDKKHSKWDLSKNILSKIEKELAITISFDIYEPNNEIVPIERCKITKINELHSLLSNFTNYKLKIDIGEAHKLYTYLKDCYYDIYQLINSLPESSIYQNTIQNFIKTSIEKIQPIYNAIEKGYITFQLGINNIDYDEDNEDNEYNKGDEDILVQSFKEDKKLYNNLPPEYLPEQAKQ